MLGEMRPSELGRWVALNAIDPFGESRADLRAGIVASVIANVNRDPKKRSEPFRAQDFMPFQVTQAKSPLPALVRAWLAPLIRKKKR